MKLFFTCPIKKEPFSSNAYTLDQGHRIVANKDGKKEIQGTVRLTSGCPLCGEKHRYEVKDIICPLVGGKNEQ